ncbi:uncharacterized protein ANIA_05087 [Aspergillus nidulans FGSC A4]|uniref:Uncharacterized protein n=1 Tax=Emericella nidulans (strain FGSC A4 / ATCC 38163 / CBS 112.46 / NRRL 194 / M139) TaxID=227321 RepID=C8V7Y8_EMENI|nr:hypothetical protein [Aspergillus nidulans FGSC A4]CBF76111.1 TPA: conserved hypothetical protein [Aspergillus nidulans FGSC A4]
MKTAGTRELFYREQTIANLRIVFGKDVDVVTCKQGYESRFVALAYVVGAEGERIQVMQSSALDVTYALRDLLALSSRRVQAYFADHNHQVAKNELATCSIVLPRKPESLLELNQPTPLKYDVLPEDEAALEEAGGDYLEAEANPGGHEAETSSSTPQYLESCNVEQKGYSILLIIEHPFHPPFGGLRYIGAPSRQVILQAISKIMSENGLSNTVYHMKTLCVKSDTGSYDILGYEYDHIEDLLDHVLKSEKFAKIECVYGIPAA